MKLKSKPMSTEEIQLAYEAMEENKAWEDEFEGLLGYKQGE